MSYDDRADPTEENSSAQTRPSDQSSWEAKVLSRISDRIGELAPELSHFGWETYSLILLRERLAPANK